MTLAANSAIPVGAYRRKAYDANQIGGAQSHAAGILFVAPDGDILMLRRAPTEENFGGHWALPGGGVDDGETPEQGAVREAQEEMGVTMKPESLRDLHKTITPTGKAFHTFAAQSPDKFAPKLNGEHTGYAWASLDMLPRPMHPAVEAMMRDRLGIGEDMKPEDWQGLRDGFMKWTAEEEQEPEHLSATDSALKLALDRDSVRSKRKDGQLVVERAHITKANVCPYRGAEIPGCDQLGLEPDKIYYLLRDPDELKKAAATLNGVQLLRKHTPVNAADHKPYDTVGSLGSNAEFVDDDGENYLDNSLFVNAQDAIDGIETGEQRELSAGYHYVPDMTPGNFRGTRFDGIMRDIVFNHVALVSDGRAGSDVVVGDSMENLKMKASRIGALTLLTVANTVSPVLAMDAKVVLPKDLFGGLTTKNFKSNKSKLLDGVRLALDGKLRKGMALDATMQGLAKAIDAFENLTDKPESMDESASESEHNAMEAAAHGQSTLDIPKEVGEEFSKADEGKTFDSAGIQEFLRGKGMGEDDIKAVCDMLPKNAMAGDEDDDEDKKKAEEKQAMDEKFKNMVSKADLKLAVDSAVQATRAATTTEVTKAVRENERGITQALHAVKPWTGELEPSLAFDSAEAVHRHAAKMLSIPNHDKMHADALLPVITAQPRPGARPTDREQSMGMDSVPAAAFDKAAKLAPGLAGIQTVL